MSDETLNDVDLKIRGLKDLRGEVRKELSLAIQSSGCMLANGECNIIEESEYLADFIKRSAKKLDNIQKKLDELEIPFNSDDIPF